MNINKFFKILKKPEKFYKLFFFFFIFFGMFKCVCWTFNNYTEEEKKRIEALDVTYMVFQQEIGRSGTRHLQGYTELKKQLSLSQLKTFFGSDRIHFERRFGTQKQAINYCKKKKTRVEGTEPFEKGEPRKQGQRSDLIEIREALRKGQTDLDLIENDELISTFSRCPHFVDRIRRCFEEKKAFEKFEEMKRCKTQEQYEKTRKQVVVYYGETGVGKTSRVYKQHKVEDIYKWCPSGGSKDSIWFDGYHGQKVVLFDDFYGTLPWSMLLNLLDNYPTQVQVKGSFVYWNPEVIYFTSNNHPMYWYHYNDKMLYSALFRRITLIEEIKEREPLTSDDEFNQTQTDEVEGIQQIQFDTSNEEENNSNDNIDDNGNPL